MKTHVLSLTVNGEARTLTPLPTATLLDVLRDELLPCGIKGIGMLGSAGIQAAIANAVHDAVGKRVRRLPIRIEEVLDQ